MPRLSFMPKSVSDLLTRLTTVEQLLVARTQGAGTITAAIAGTSVGTVAVTFDKAMPDTSYAVVGVNLEGVSGISGVLTPVLPVTAKTTTGCSVGIKNNGLLALGVGATVRVTVAKLA